MLRDALRRARFRALARLARWRLGSLSGPALHARAEKAAVAAFHRAARRVPAYRAMLAERGVDPAAVTDAASFARRVPTTDKQSVFAEHGLADLCVDGRADDAACVYTSSGYSGTFSFGLETAGEMRRGRDGLDLLLEFYLQATRRRTLLVNALPMGVRVPASLAMTIDTSTRPDAALAVIRKLRGICEQTVLVGEHPFLKALIEDGVEARLDWPAHRVSLVTGAEVMPESFRAYVGAILGHRDDRPENGRIMVSTGISEVGLTIGHETDAPRRIRRAAADDADLRAALFGPTPYLPSFVQYFPAEYYIETPEDETGRPRLVVTTCHPKRKLPLIRYATGDWAKCMTCAQVRDALRRCGRDDLEVDFELPFLALWGRGKGLDVAGREIFPEQVKEALYDRPDLVGRITANFTMAPRAGRLAVRLQLKAAVEPSGQLAGQYAEAIARRTGVEVQVEPVAFDRMPGALAVNYQRKFRYFDAGR